MRSLERLLRLFDAAAAGLVGLMLVIITLVLFANAVARYFANFTIIGGDEFARCLMIWMTFLGSYLLVRVQGHVTIDLLAKALTGRLRTVLNISIAMIGLVICAYVAKLGYDITDRVYSSGQRMSSLPFARAWFYLPVPIGFGLMALAFVQIIAASYTGLPLRKLADFGPSQPDPAPDTAQNKDA
jgi:TRAP-type C4-dicarboxylate transport system permease small subunit